MKPQSCNTRSYKKHTPKKTRLHKTRSYKVYKKQRLLKARGYRKFKKYKKTKQKRSHNTRSHRKDEVARQKVTKHTQRMKLRATKCYNKYENIAVSKTAKIPQPHLLLLSIASIKHD